MQFPNPVDQKAIVERYARLLSVVAPEIGKRPLVLPTGECFPDRFTPDAAGAATLVDRMLGHAGLDDVPLTTQVVDEQGPEAPHGGCSSGCQVPAAVAGTVPRLVDDGERWTLNIPVFELAHPVVLTTLVARALGHVFLVEAVPRGERIEGPAELTADYAAVALGFGPLLMEGAHIYSKGCGGPQVAQVTQASLPELALTTALFVAMGEHSPRRALRELGTTQQALLREACDWAASNRALTQLLARDPVRVSLGDYPLGEARPWLLRIFGNRAASEAEVRPTPVRRTPSPPDAKRAELRALVDEALEAAARDAE